MLKDVLSANLDIVFCGTAKGKVSAMLGFYYAGPGNKFYDILFKAGFTDKQLLPNDCYNIYKYNIGLTDLVHTESGNDNEINEECYEVSGFISKMKKYNPKVIAFTSKKAAAFALGFNGITKHIEYGLQNTKIGNSKVYVLTSTSGSARKYWDETYWFELNKLIKK